MFASDQEVGELMRAVDRHNMTGWFTWIGSDGWGGRVLVSNGNEPQVRTGCGGRVLVSNGNDPRGWACPRLQRQRTTGMNRLGGRVLVSNGNVPQV